MLLRPDGHVAWVAERSDDDARAADALARSLGIWFTRLAS
jgi:hypothetical protein